MSNQAAHSMGHSEYLIEVHSYSDVARGSAARDGSKNCRPQMTNIFKH